MVRSTSDTVRFRDARCWWSCCSNNKFSRIYNYKNKNDARVSTDYAVANFFFFTVDTDTATIGEVKGGGVGCSVGPVTLSA